MQPYYDTTKHIAEKFHLLPHFFAFFSYIILKSDENITL
jgi:hypothetical protein